MTDNEIELALETIALVLEDLKKTQEKQQSTVTALEEALSEHAMREVQRLGQEIEQEPVPCCGKYETCTRACTPRGRFLGKREALAQPERHELQAKGEHPAPCARHCEANAFQIVIKNLKAQLAQPEQEPVAWMDADGNVSDNNDHKCFPIPLYTQPPQRTWVELTDEDRNDCLVEADPCECLATPEAQELMRCVEAKLKELNHGK